MAQLTCQVFTILSSVTRMKKIQISLPCHKILRNVTKEALNCTASSLQLNRFETVKSVTTLLLILRLVSILSNWLIFMESDKVRMCFKSFFSRTYGFIHVGYPSSHQKKEHQSTDNITEYRWKLAEKDFCHSTATTLMVTLC